MEFKDRLKNLRESKGMSQVELAEALGLSHTTIGMYESGKRAPRENIREIIANYFNVDTGYLMGYDRTKYYTDPATVSAQGLLAKNPKLVELVKVASELTTQELDIFIKTMMFQVECHNDETP